MTTLPHWNLTNVYPGLESAEYEAERQQQAKLLDTLEAEFKETAANFGPQSDPAALAACLSSLIDQINTLMVIGGTLRTYVMCHVTTDSFNKLAMKRMSELEQTGVRFQQLSVRFAAWVGKLGPVLEKALELPGSAQEHAFFLHEAVEESRYLMGEAEEALAAELNLSGANAWGKLQGTVTSQMTVDFELDGEVKKMPITAIINLRGHPDEAVRRRAYDAENQAWESVKEPLAAAMNGIKGSVNILNRKRGRRDALHQPLDMARIDQATLDAMLGAMKDSFPMFRRYFQAKAARLGKEKLAWWDLFAPVGKNERTYSWEDTQEFILKIFDGFSPVMGDMAKRAFAQNWIDAEPRAGKRAGAFCASIMRTKESRVLCNFDGTLDQVSTVAHELGHAFHNECMFRAGKKPLLRSSPMTLAETASIMCETIATETALAEAQSADEKLGILETSLIGSSQVIVDIYSRFLFEQQVFERRAKSELSADDLNEIMEWSQKETYGDGLDERYLQKWMWTWKPHYYSGGLSFYNFPYAFGLLFGLGLYAIYQQRGADFVGDYMNLLSSTGEAPAAELAARFGIDIRSKEFWAASLAIIGRQIDAYTQL